MSRLHPLPFDRLEGKGIQAIAVELEAFLKMARGDTTSPPTSSDACRRAVERFTGRLGS
jgi:hypothetical protein